MAPVTLEMLGCHIFVMKRTYKTQKFSTLVFNSFAYVA